MPRDPSDGRSGGQPSMWRGCRLRSGAGWGHAVACLACLAVTGFAPVAQAAAQTFVTLELEVAPDDGGCPDAEEFRASVGRQLGYDPFRPDAEKRVAVQIGRKDGGFEGRIRWSDAHQRWAGERHLSSRRSDCREIAASVAFSVAVQIQLLAALAPPKTPAPSSGNGTVPPTLGSNASVEPRANGSAVSPAPVSVRGEATPRAAPEAPSGPPQGEAVLPKEEAGAVASTRRLALWGGGGPSLAFKMAPGPAGSGRVFVAGRVAQLSLEVSVDAALPAEQRQPDGSGFSLYWYAAGAAVCGHAWALAACVTSRLGRVEARGFGVDAPASPSGGVYQMGARLAATYDLGGRYFVAARAEGLVSLSSWTITLNDVPVWVTPRGGALIGLDLGGRLF